MNEREARWFGPLMRAADERGFGPEAWKAAWIPRCEATPSPEVAKAWADLDRELVAEGWVSEDDDPGLRRVFSYRLYAEILLGRLGWTDYPSFSEEER